MRCKIYEFLSYSGNVNTISFVVIISRNNSSRLLLFLVAHSSEISAVPSLCWAFPWITSCSQHSLPKEVMVVPVSIRKFLGAISKVFILSRPGLWWALRRQPLRLLLAESTLTFPGHTWRPLVLLPMLPPGLMIFLSWRPAVPSSRVSFRLFKPPILGFKRSLCGSSDSRADEHIQVHLW